MSKNFLILFCFIGCLFAESGSSFRYGVNAKSISMGGTSASVYNYGFNGLINPAFLTKIDKPEFGISFFKMSLDRSIQAFSYSRNLPPSAGIALSFFKSGIDQIIVTDINNNFIEKTDQWEGYGAMSFGFKFMKRSSLGFTLKAYINELYDYSAKGIGFDFGFIVNPSEFVDLGICVQNLGSKYKWEIGGQKYDEDILMMLQLGFTYRQINNMVLTGQLDKVENQDALIRFGMEYEFQIPKNDISVFLRAGIKERNSDLLFFTGFGIPVKLSNRLKLLLDYSIDPGMMDEGVSHLFSFSLLNN
mgnify:CR=1 FL=1|tara:strand:- start:979 stop:1887 length:909 start_codon:yes stop_codon:yes gene_type:complete